MDVGSSRVAADIPNCCAPLEPSTQFYFILLKSPEVDYFFFYLLAICSSLWKVSSLHSPLIDWVAWFLIWFLNFLHYLDINSPSDLQLVKTFFHSVRCLFTWVTVSLASYMNCLFTVFSKDFFLQGLSYVSIVGILSCLSPYIYIYPFLMILWEDTTSTWWSR